MTLGLRTQDPSANLDYQIDWSAWLGSGETISSSSWTVDAGLDKGTTSFTDSTTTIWLSGGSNGGVYSVKNQITTSASRTEDRTFKLLIEEH